MKPIIFEVNGPPLSEITPGVYDLSLRDGMTVLAVVDCSEDGSPWWAPLGAAGDVVDCSTDWTNVVGATAIGVEQLAQRRPDLMEVRDLHRLRASESGPLSISGRGRA